MKTIKLKVLEREWLKLWLNDIIKNNNGSEIELNQAKKILVKLEESK